MSYSAREDKESVTKCAYWKGQYDLCMTVLSFMYEGYTLDKVRSELLTLKSKTLNNWKHFDNTTDTKIY